MVDRGLDRDILHVEELDLALSGSGEYRQGVLERKKKKIERYVVVCVCVCLCVVI